MGVGGARSAPGARMTQGAMIAGRLGAPHMELTYEDLAQALPHLGHLGLTARGGSP